MFQQDQKAGELHEAEEVLNVVLPARDQAAEVMHPCKKPLHFPAPAVAPQLATVLRLAASPPVGRNHLDVVLFGEPFVELVRVVGFVADEPGREFV